ncbi:MAG: DUF3293 domain-containing protein [Blastomonas sp.]
MNGLLLPNRTAFGAESVLPADLVRSYCDAFYAFRWIMGVYEELVLDHYNPLLEAMMSITGAGTAMLISAFNPLGTELPDSNNYRRHRALTDEMAGARARAIPAYGRNPAGGCSDDSLLVLGLTFDAALDLGQSYEQNALIWSDGTFIPRLVLLR